MFCIYCGSQTENSTKICDACAAKQVQSSPFQPEAPLMTAASETVNIPEQAPFQPETLTQPDIPQEPAPQPNSYNYQWQGFAPEQPPIAPQQPQAPQPEPEQDSTEHIKALKNAMSSFPAMMCAILLSATALFNIINFFVSTNGSVGPAIGMLFSIGAPMLLTAAGAWISYLSAKGEREIPITAGLKMATAVGIIDIIAISVGLVIFFVGFCVVAAAGGLASLYGTDFAKFFGSNFVAIASISFAVILAVFGLAMVAMILCIIFVAHCNKNLGIMRNVLMGRTKNVKLSFFPVIWLYVIAACNVIGIINNIDTLISGEAFAQLTGIAAPSAASSVIGIFVFLCTGASAVFGALAIAKCRKDLLEVQ